MKYSCKKPLLNERLYSGKKVGNTNLVALTFQSIKITQDGNELKER